MKNSTFFTRFILITIAILGFSCSQQYSTEEAHRTSTFDLGWSFIKDNPVGAEEPVFNDAEWRKVDLPHDWSIEDLPNQHEDSIIGPFTKASIGKMSTGYTVGGTSWYRKSFTIDKADQDKIAYLQFDGVYMNSDIWINGKHIGNHPYGYTSFYFNITPFLNPAGQPNIVAVQVKNEGRNSRWYSGSGIYRHTWLTLVHPIHIGTWGVNVKTNAVSEKSAVIDIVASLVNSGKEETPVSLTFQIIDPSGKVVGKTEGNSYNLADSLTDISQSITIENPALWSTENPTLYQAKVTVIVNNKEVDNLNTTFGIRSIKFDAQTGFTLNGKSVELKGGCFHHDNGPLGSAAIDRAEERKIELLKSSGFNAIRCSHNPPSPYLLDVCDRMGMLVIDEICDMWESPKNPDDYALYFKEWWQKDIQSMLLRDRNHPSVIMWSIGNEIFEATDSSGLKIATNLSAEVRKFDTSRAVTQALVDISSFMPGAKPWDSQTPVMELLDVAGYNYGFNKYEEDHIKFPNRVMYASESMPPLSFQNWQMVEKLPYVIGNFTWTAMDYLGEAAVGIPRLLEIENKNSKDAANFTEMMVFFNPESWPAFNNFQGDLDLIGNPKTPYYYQHVVWRESKLEMLIHKPIPEGKRELTSPWGFPDELKSWSWSGNEGKKIQVHVYTRSQLVKLELNGKVIGEQTVDETKSITATFEVPYEPGTLTARCFDNGKETASETIKTVGIPASIRMKADREVIKADRNDLSYVMVEIIDADGAVIPYADDILVNFEISGNGKIAGVGNGNPYDLSSFQQPRKKTYQGRCLVILSPGLTAGDIIITAKSDGLKEGSLIVKAE